MSNTTSTPSTMETSEGCVVYSVKEISQLLHTNAALIYRFIELGLLPAIKLGSLRVRKQALDQFLVDYEGLDLSNPEEIRRITKAS